MNEGTVYVVQEPPPVYRNGSPIMKDLSSAQRYGKLMPILGSSDQASMTPGPALHKMQRELRSFNPEYDFICFAGGDPMSLALALVVLRDMGFREVQSLRWERERDTNGSRKPGGFYVPVSTPLRIT